MFIPKNVVYGSPSTFGALKHEVPLVVYKQLNPLLIILSNFIINKIESLMKGGNDTNRFYLTIANRGHLI